MRQFLLYLAGALSLVLLQALPTQVLFPGMATFNFSFTFLVFVALSCPSPGSFFIAFILGLSLETLSGCPPGLLVLINLSLLFIIRVAVKFVLFETLTSQLVLVFLLNVVIDLFLLAVLDIAFHNPLALMLPRVVAKSAVATALSVPLFLVYNSGWLSPEA